MGRSSVSELEMATIVRAGAPAQAQAQPRPAVDVTKIVLWIVAASLPWAAIILAAKFAIRALA
jgi:hypothetical protein